MSREGQPPYFPFYPDDFASDRNVEAMSTLAVGAYILLLCKAWREEPAGSLPNDDRLLARWARLSADEWAACSQEVLAAFTLCGDNRWHQKRMRQEYDRMRQIRNAKSQAGKKGMEKRWHDNRTINTAITPLITNDNLASASSSASADKKEKSPPPPAGGGGVAPGGAARAGWDQGKAFQEFWQAYPAECPRKAERAKCEETFRRLVKTEGVFRQLLRALELDRQSRDWLKEGGQYINAPLVWLRKKRWLDDLDQERATTPTPGARPEAALADGQPGGPEPAAERCRPAPEPSDEAMEHRHRRYLIGIGYCGERLEAAMDEFRSAIAS